MRKVTQSERLDRLPSVTTAVLANSAACHVFVATVYQAGFAAATIPFQRELVFCVMVSLAGSVGTYFSRGPAAFLALHLARGAVLLVRHPISRWGDSTRDQLLDDGRAEVLLERALEGAALTALRGLVTTTAWSR